MIPEFGLPGRRAAAGDKKTRHGNQQYFFHV
jgi:hypothetical protein